jgi:ATP-dependent DNA helicase RecQ
MNHYFIKFVFNTNKFNFIPLISKKDILRKYWGFSSFREKQEDIVDAVLKKQDTLALLPTGGGKSLCYQVPGMILEGVCLVISPLIALMEDQVKALKSKGIKAVAINSSMSKR